jgi:hypothetical protein
LLRIDFPSHYGNEYYCPVSSLKVWGMNQMEAFRWEQKRIAKGKDDDERSKRKQQLATSDGSGAKRTPMDPENDKIMWADDTAYGQTQIPMSSAAPTSSSYAATSTAVDTIQTAAPVESTPGTAVPVTTESSTTATTTSSPLATDSANDTSLTAAPSQISNPLQEQATSATTKQPVDANDNQAPFVVTGTSESSVSALTTPQTSNTAAPSQSNIEDDARTAAQSPSDPSFSTASLSSPSSAVTVRPVPTARVDSSESIYAFIIRRLNALEGNTTLTAMYVEQQFEATRALLSRMEKGLETRQAELAAELKKERDAEVCGINGQHRRVSLIAPYCRSQYQSLEKRLNLLVQKLEKQVSAVHKERHTMHKQLRALADEVRMLSHSSCDICR